jgi:hypothetical protein
MWCRAVDDGGRNERIMKVNLMKASVQEEQGLTACLFSNGGRGLVKDVLLRCGHNMRTQKIRWKCNLLKFVAFNYCRPVDHSITSNIVCVDLIVLRIPNFHHHFAPKNSILKAAPHTLIDNVTRKGKYSVLASKLFSLPPMNTRAGTISPTTFLSSRQSIYWC